MVMLVILNYYMTLKLVRKIWEYVDSLISTDNPKPPDEGSWSKPELHPCKRSFKDIPNTELDDDYIDILDTVQRHTRCSTN